MDEHAIGNREQSEEVTGQLLVNIHSEVTAMGDLQGDGPVNWSAHAQAPAVELVRARLLALPTDRLAPVIIALHTSFAPPEATDSGEPQAEDGRTHPEREVYDFLSRVLRDPGYAGWGSARNRAIQDGANHSDLPNH